MYLYHLSPATSGQKKERDRRRKPAVLLSPRRTQLCRHRPTRTGAYALSRSSYKASFSSPFPVAKAEAATHRRVVAHRPPASGSPRAAPQLHHWPAADGVCWRCVDRHGLRVAVEWVLAPSVVCAGDVCFCGWVSDLSLQKDGEGGAGWVCRCSWALGAAMAHVYNRRQQARSQAVCPLCDVDGRWVSRPCHQQTKAQAEAFAHQIAARIAAGKVGIETPDKDPHALS